MSSYLTSENFSKIYTKKNVTIPNGGSLSEAVDLEQLNITGIFAPASWTNAVITFQASPDGLTYSDVLDFSGAEKEITVVAGKFISINLPELSGIRFVKIRSGNSASPVNQGSDRLLSIVLTSNPEVGDGITPGNSKRSSVVEFNRPADTTAYAALDTVSPILTVSDATNASPIVITTSSSHGLSDGDPVTVVSVGGNTNANGNYFAKVTGYSPTTFGLYTDKALTVPKAGNSSYTSGGSVIKILRFSKLAKAPGGKGFVVKAQIFTTQKTCVAQFKLHLFTVPPTGILDNSPYLSLWTNRAYRIGQVVFPALATEDPTNSDNANAIASLDAIGSNVPLSFSTDSADQDVYGILETLTAFTPVSGQSFYIRLMAQD